MGGLGTREFQDLVAPVSQKEEDTSKIRSNQEFAPYSSLTVSKGAIVTPVDFLLGIEIK